MLIGLARDAIRMILNRRFSRRAIAAAFKVRGRRLERTWPFIPRADGARLNLLLPDVLALQHARSRDLVVMTIGAFDGITNDPVVSLIREHGARALLVEPQPEPFRRLEENFANLPVKCVQAAIDAQPGSRTMYFVPGDAPGLPTWTQQLASFERQHLLKHEPQAPGLATQIQQLEVEALTFDLLLDRYGVNRLDVLQIDAEGADARLLSLFPFERLAPDVVIYETAHLQADELEATRRALIGRGYRVFEAESGNDDMAVRV